MADKNLSRIRRQFDALSRTAPPARHVIEPLTRNGMRWLRMPLSLVFILGGFVSFLPIFGLWMLPLGLLLLAIDIPPLRPAVANASIRSRRRFGRLVRRRREAAAQR